MHQSLPTDLLPNPLAGDYLDACTWWLQNPLLGQARVLQQVAQRVALGGRGVAHRGGRDGDRRRERGHLGPQLLRQRVQVVERKGGWDGER